MKNRLVALPVFTGYAFPDGSVSPLLIKHYKKLAGAGVAMVIVANAAVAAEGVTSRYNLRIDRDEFIAGLNELAETIKRQGALAAIQLNHAGRFAKTDRPLLVSPVDATNLPYNLATLKDFINAFPLEKRIGITRFFLKQINTWHRAMTADEMNQVIESFHAAAMRAHRAGFDMIELHGANGYLLCEFLSPATNKLRNGFGGTFHHRAAFPLAVIKEIRRDLPMGYPVGFRLLLNEWVPGGIALEEAITFAKLAEKAGISYFSAAAGTFNSVFTRRVAKQMAREAYLREDVTRLTREVKVPTIISGRVTSPSLAAELLREKTADLIGLGRPLRADINWVKKAQMRQTVPIRACLNCNWCLKRVILEQGFICARWSKLVRQRTNVEHMRLSRNYRSLWVITDRADIPRFKHAIPALLPASRSLPSTVPPTLLFLRNKSGMCSAKDRTDFSAWAQAQLGVSGYPDIRISVDERQNSRPWSTVIGEEIQRHRYGLVLLASNRDNAWTTRLLYLEHHNVIGLIGNHYHPSKMVTFLDLSDASLMVLVFLRQAYICKPDVKLTFMHILNGSQRRAEDRWAELKRISGNPAALHMNFIDPAKNVGATILATIARGNYGTVIMGKRGLSGIKRLLLGSVSRAVLAGLTDQNLLLVD